MGDNNIGWEGGIESFTRTKIKHNEEKQNVNCTNVCCTSIPNSKTQLQIFVLLCHNCNKHDHITDQIDNECNKWRETTISHVMFLHGDCDHGKINKISRSWLEGLNFCYLLCSSDIKPPLRISRGL